MIHWNEIGPKGGVKFDSDKISKIWEYGGYGSNGMGASTVAFTLTDNSQVEFTISGKLPDIQKLRQVAEYFESL